MSDLALRERDCGMRLRRRSAGGVWLGFPLGRGDVPRADDAKRPSFEGMEKELKAYVDAAQSDEEIGVWRV